MSDQEPCEICSGYGCPDCRKPKRDLFPDPGGIVVITGLLLVALLIALRWLGGHQ